MPEEKEYYKDVGKILCNKQNEVKNDDGRGNWAYTAGYPENIYSAGGMACVHDLHYGIKTAV